MWVWFRGVLVLGVPMLRHWKIRNGRLQQAGVFEWWMVRTTSGLFWAQPGKRLCTYVVKMCTYYYYFAPFVGSYTSWDFPLILYSEFIIKIILFSIFKLKSWFLIKYLLFSIDAYIIYFSSVKCYCVNEKKNLIYEIINKIGTFTIYRSYIISILYAYNNVHKILFKSRVIYY